MTVIVKLTWTNPSERPADMRIERRDGEVGEAEYAYVGQVSPDAEHNSTTAYKFDDQPNLSAQKTIYYRIVTIGVTGAEVIGNELSISVPGIYDIAAIGDLAGTVVIE